MVEAFDLAGNSTKQKMYREMPGLIPGTSPRTEEDCNSTQNDVGAILSSVQMV